MSCPPSYPYRPDFTPSSVQCFAPWFVEHRSRLTEGEAFFRSIDQGPETSFIQLEHTGTLLNVYFNGVPVESFAAGTGIGSIAALRALIGDENTLPGFGSDYIRMPTLNYDVFDDRVTEDDLIIGLTTFSLTYMRGGAGGPTTSNALAAIRTGPERTLIILATTEASDGSPVTPAWFNRVRQWNGSAWVTYSNLAVNNCPYDGTE